MSDLKAFRDVIDPGLESNQDNNEQPQVIENLEQLLSKFGLTLDEVNLFNKYLYKGTDCGASVSIQTPDGVWHHNGDDWTGITEAIAFTIQTIVEGSDLTVDSESFTFPVSIKTIDDWCSYMEEQAERIWEQANCEHYFISLGEETVGAIKIYQGNASVEPWNENSNLPIEELAVIAADQCNSRDYPESIELPPINGVVYSLEKYQPECY
jgi:hypothetical protein